LTIWRISILQIPEITYFIFLRIENFAFLTPKIKKMG